MANVKISDLTAASAASSTQEFEVNDSLTSKKVTGAQILDFVQANTTAADIGAIDTDDIGVSVQAYDADLTTWAGKTAPSGTVVGTSDSQTLTSKTLTTPVLTGTQETKVAMAANDVDCSTGNYFSKTISTTTTLTVSNVPTTGNGFSFILDLTNGGSSTITWWSGMDWAGGTAPTLTASGRDVLGFFTYDGGTTWTGLVLGKDVK